MDLEMILNKKPEMVRQNAKSMQNRTKLSAEPIAEGEKPTKYSKYNRCKSLTYKGGGADEIRMVTPTLRTKNWRFLLPLTIAQLHKI